MLHAYCSFLTVTIHNIVQYKQLIFLFSFFHTIFSSMFKIYFSIFPFFSASFRIGIPTPKQIDRLNTNALVSLTNDFITTDKIRINLFANPHTLFLAPSNSTVAKLNQQIIEILFANHVQIAQVMNGIHEPMDIYRNMTVIITENRYFLFFQFTCCKYLIL